MSVFNLYSSDAIKNSVTQAFYNNYISNESINLIQQLLGPINEDLKSVNTPQDLSSYVNSKISEGLRRHVIAEIKRDNGNKLAVLEYLIFEIIEAAGLQYQDAYTDSSDLDGTSITSYYLLNSIANDPQLRATIGDQIFASFPYLAKLKNRHIVTGDDLKKLNYPINPSDDFIIGLEKVLISIEIYGRSPNNKDSMLLLFRLFGVNNLADMLLALAQLIINSAVNIELDKAPAESDIQFTTLLWVIDAMVRGPVNGNNITIPDGLLRRIFSMAK